MPKSFYHSLILELKYFKFVLDFVRIDVNPLNMSIIYVSISKKEGK